MRQLSQIDRSLDEASLTLGARSFGTLTRVILPMLRPAVVTAMVYSFVRAITAVSAVIFLVTGRYNLATVYIVGRADVGDYGVAIVYAAMLVVFMMLVLVAIQLLVGERLIGRRAEAPPIEAPALVRDEPYGASPAVEFRAVSQALRHGDGLDSVSFSIERGTLVTLLGPSGCGKTTILRLIAGLEQATTGSILIGGEDVTVLSAAERDVSMVFQSYALFPHMTVLENVCYGLRASGMRKAPATTWRRRNWRWSVSPATARACRVNCPAASNSAWPWRAPSCWSPRCCCSTSRCPISMPVAPARARGDPRLQQ